MSTTTGGADFRDWFWGEAALLAGSGGDIEQSMIARIQEAFQRDLRSIRLPSDLKLRFAENVGGVYELGCSKRPMGAGFSTRAEDGERVLNQQRKIQAGERLKLIRKIFGKEPGLYQQCPCNSKEKFRFCCGNRRPPAL